MKRNRRSGMSRRRFLGASAAGLAGAAMYGSGVAYAASPVIGQNNPELDVTAVQNAVNAQDIIVLQGTFDFGDEGFVTLSGARSIEGTGSSNGKPATVINGGYFPFRLEGVGNKTVRNIFFNEPNAGAISIDENHASSTVDIEDNRIEHSLWESIYKKPKAHRRRLLWEVPEEITDFGTGFRHYTAIYTSSGAEFKRAKGYPRLYGYMERDEPAVQGTINVSNNVIDLEVGQKPTTPDVFDTWSFGFASFGAHADIYLSGNKIINCSSKGISLEDNSGNCTVTGNHIYQGSVGSTRSSAYSTWGIDTEYAWNWFGTSDVNYLPAEAGTYLIERNTIEPLLPGFTVPKAFGIGGFGNSTSSTVGSYRIYEYSNVYNHIILDNGAWAISMGDNDRGLVANNLIEGNGDYFIWPFTYYYSKNIRYTSNNIKNYTSNEYDIFFETYDSPNEIEYNVVSGHGGTVYDMGVNNKYKGKWHVEYEYPDIQ